MHVVRLSYTFPIRSYNRNFIFLDKWKHCIHVFSKDGDYLRSIGQKGSRLGMFRSPEGIATDNANLHIYIVDTGNDRVQVRKTSPCFFSWKKSFTIFVIAHLCIKYNYKQWGIAAGADVCFRH